MAPIDIVVLAVVGIAFVAVCVRIYRKGTCADCAQGGVCTGHCSNKRRAPRLRAWTKSPKTWAVVSSKARTSKRPASIRFAGALRIGRERGELKSIFRVSFKISCGEIRTGFLAVKGLIYSVFHRNFLWGGLETLHAVPDTHVRLNHLRVRGVCLDLLAQGAHEHAQARQIAVPARAPYLAGDEGVGEHLCRRFFFSPEGRAICTRFGVSESSRPSFVAYPAA